MHLVKVLLRSIIAIGPALALVTCSPAPRGGIATDELAAFVDSIIPAEMARERIPGAAFVFVQDGRVVLTRGYGMADVEQRREVDASTIWRIGSISKVFTATAVMQLVDRGDVELDAPVGRYVHRVTIPDTYPEPVTVRHLLTHTGGFDEIRPGTQAETADGVLPLAEFLRDKLVRVRPPGRTIAYSTYGITLAGEMVEEVSDMSIETYDRPRDAAPPRLAGKTSIATVRRSGRTITISSLVSFTMRRAMLGTAFAWPATYRRPCRASRTSGPIMRADARSPFASVERSAVSARQSE